MQHLLHRKFDIFSLYQKENYLLGYLDRINNYNPIL